MRQTPIECLTFREMAECGEEEFKSLLGILQVVREVMPQHGGGLANHLLRRVYVGPKGIKYDPGEEPAMAANLSSLESPGRTR